MIDSFKKMNLIKKILVISAVPSLLYAIAYIVIGIYFPEYWSRIDDLNSFYRYLKSVFSMFIICVIYIGVFAALINLLKRHNKQDDDGDSIVDKFKRLKFIYKILIISAVPAFIYTAIMIVIDIQNPPINFKLLIRCFFNIYMLFVIKIGLIGLLVRLFQK